MEFKPWHILTVLALILAVFVVLSLTQNSDDFDAIFRWVVIVLGIFGVGAHLNAKTDKQNDEISEIKAGVQTVEHQTNGVLAEKIRTEVSAGIAAEVPAAVQQALADFMAQRSEGGPAEDPGSSGG